MRAALYGLVGTDLTQIHGLGSSLALKLIGACGTDLRAWPTAKHFTSWLCLAPGNKISGGKVLSSRTRRSSSRAAALLRLAAATLHLAHSTGGWQGVLENRKPSRRPHAGLPSFSTMRCGLGWCIAIQARLPMMSAIVVPPLWQKLPQGRPMGSE
ncbi:transposase [Agrobacterium fabrum]|uniref:transposase n=1 Tax=Agrobacterium fabrum TaxID=1176649 RepID=UPI003BA386FA